VELGAVGWGNGFGSLGQVGVLGRWRLGVSVVAVGRIGNGFCVL